MTIILTKSKNYQIRRETEKPIFYLDRELKVINLTNTTSINEFCEIIFTDNRERKIVQQHKLDMSEVEKCV